AIGSIAFFSQRKKQIEQRPSLKLDFVETTLPVNRQSVTASITEALVSGFHGLSIAMSDDQIFPSNYALTQANAENSALQRYAKLSRGATQYDIYIYDRVGD